MVLCGQPASPNSSDLIQAEETAADLHLRLPSPPTTFGVETAFDVVICNSLDKHLRLWDGCEGRVEPFMPARVGGHTVLKGHTWRELKASVRQQEHGMGLILGRRQPVQMTAINAQVLAWRRLQLT